VLDTLRAGGTVERRESRSGRQHDGEIRARFVAAKRATRARELERFEKHRLRACSGSPCVSLAFLGNSPTDARDVAPHRAARAFEFRGNFILNLRVGSAGPVQRLDQI
jgi:hypothetical protein